MSSFSKLSILLNRGLKEPGKTQQSTSYMWVQTCGPPGKRVSLYDYYAGRSGQVPVLNALRVWLDSALSTVPTQTAPDKALAYLDNY